MKYGLLIISALILTACGVSQKPPQAELIVDKETHAMSRNEVINGIIECESNGMRAAVLMSKKKLNGHTVETPVDVHCYPKFKL